MVKRDPKLNGALSGTCGVSKISDSACAMGVEGHSSPLVSPENSRQRQVKSVPSVGIYRPPPARKARCDNQVDSQQDQQASDSSQSSKANRQKRPDRAVYVPRHRRSNEPEGSPLSRETCRPPKSTRERRSTTTSPAHASSRSSADDIGATIDSCRLIQGREHEIDGSDALTVLGADRINKNYCQAFESAIRQDLPISSSCGGSAKTNDRVSDEKLANLEADTSLKETSQRRDSLVMLHNGVTEESTDVCSIKESGTVQRDTGSNEEPQERHETGFILDSCDGRARLSEVNLDREITSNVEMEEIAVTDSSQNLSQVVECETICSKDETNGDASHLIMPIDSNRKEEKTKEELLNRDEVVNHKNRRIIRQNLVSDVLLISDEKPGQEITIKEPPAIPVSPSSQTKDKKIKKVERPKSKPAPPPLPPSKVNRDECDWDSLFDDNGDCLDPTLIEELTTAVGEVTIEQPRSDYRAYSKAPIEVSNDEFAHVVEIYNFPSDFKTSDLAAVFSPFKNGGFELKWVDDTHCLGVFSSPLIAAEVLASDHSFVKTRPLSEATALSKTKARRSAEFLQPYRARPETCAALARRLVTGALGVRLATARQEREREKIVLREAKERRRLANKQREDAWEGIIAEK